jgi:hypothetical protein
MHELEAMGYEVRIPKTAHIMQEKNDFDVSHYKTWIDDPSKIAKKQELMEGHFEEVRASDAILVVNDEKHGVAGYIGGNVLMEITLAYLLKKPIFVLHTIDKKHNLYEEILGVGAVQLGSNIKNLKLS